LSLGETDGKRSLGGEETEQEDTRKKTVKWKINKKIANERKI
jgi:hypothetical protein